MTPQTKLILGTLWACAVLALIFLVGIASVPVFSQTRVPLPLAECSPRLDLVTKLREEYGETRLGMGPKGVSPDLLRGKPGASLVDVEIFLNPDTGTWTVFTTKDGNSCVRLTGKNWRWGSQIEDEPV